MDWPWRDGMERFRDRHDAGRRLAERLFSYRGRRDVAVLALPRGGVPVGFEVARPLEAPLDVLVVRKLGVPGQEELAMGAIASGNVRVLNPEVVGPLGIPEHVIERVASREQLELERREKLFRGQRPALDPAGQTVIMVDDGLATGSTMKAAITALRRRDPAEIVVAVPVAPASTCREMAGLADRVVCLVQAEMFGGVGEWYDDFRQTTDSEVRALLDAARPAWKATVSVETEGRP